MSEFRYISAKDIEWFYTGMPGHPFMAITDLVQFMKDAGTITTQLTPSYYNVVYGAQVWRQLNTEANIFGFLPKTSWPRSGWRVVSAWGTSTSGSIVTGETGAIPGPYYPTVKVVKTTPKVLSVSFEVSEVMEELASKSADDIWAGLDQIRVHFGLEFQKRINQLLMAPAVGKSSTDVPTYNANSIISIDQIASSSDEASGVYGASVPSSVTSLVNVYGLDRFNADGWANATVLHNNGTARSLTDDLIRQLDAQTMTKGANPQAGRFWVTGLRTWTAINGLYMNFVRYLPMSEARVSVGEQGYKYVDEGSGVGLRVAQLYNKPVIITADAYADAGGLERLYLLDVSDLEGVGSPRLGISVLRPVEYFETNPSHFPLLKQFVFRGVYRMIADTVARFLPGQGKLRDLQ
ncbi:MAG: hypothetical protein QW320_06750 [Ignisphaera sp.]|uniref:hypothetical protein n=1 Tax=Thermofilum sp. TaxID=1961369 RepID=UPI0031681186